MRTLYADFNDFDANDNLPLSCAGSVESIRALDPPLVHGERVWLTDGELWVSATVVLTETGQWEARSLWDYLESPPDGTSMQLVNSE